MLGGSDSLTRASFEATRSVENRGTLKNYSAIVITAPMINRGSWDAYAGVWANNTVVNEWDFMNRAGFSPQLFVNRGYMTNFYSVHIGDGVQFSNVEDAREDPKFANTFARSVHYLF